MTTSQELVQQFRAVALQRLDRVEAAWATVLSNLDDDAAGIVHHEIHTLKGESRMLGFTDVNLVCHKLEDLLEVARTRGYAVNEDFDLAVNMALRFMAMLVRKKVGTKLHGIDLPGFIKQIEGILAEVSRDSRTTRTTGQLVAIKRDANNRYVPPVLAARLAPCAVDAFVEYAAARGGRRDRLRSSWHGLRELIGIQRAVVGSGQLAKHKTNAHALARDLGKQLEVVFEVDAAEVTVEILAAIDAAAIHLVRNAVDHGIETPATRLAAGKPAAGKILLSCRVQGESLTLSVEDDGHGIPIDDVRGRAIELGLSPPASLDDRDRWLDLVCQPGFSTRLEASDVSGRGVGLAAVRSMVGDVGGTLGAITAANKGSTWTITIPLPTLTINGHLLRVPEVPFPIVIDERWMLTASGSVALESLDLAMWLGLVDAPSVGSVQCHFHSGTTAIAIIADQAPTPAVARRVIATAAPSPFEVVVVDSVEALLVHPDRLATR